jgi:hypothetical protein
MMPTKKCTKIIKRIVDDSEIGKRMEEISKGLIAKADKVKLDPGLPQHSQ